MSKIETNAGFLNLRDFRDCDTWCFEVWVVPAARNKGGGEVFEG